MKVYDAPPQCGHDDDEYVDEGERPDVSDLLPLASELKRLLALDEYEDEYDLDEHEDDEDEGDPPPPPGPEALQSAYAVALQLAARLDRDEERFWALDEVTEFDLLEALFDLPLDLARAGMVDEGAELGLALSFVEPDHFLGDRAVLLADAGRREEALAQVTQILESLPANAWVESKAGETYASLGEPLRAEAHFRAALERAEDDYQRGSAVDRLAELLYCQNRATEADALLAAEDARLAACGAGQPRHRSSPHRQSRPQ